MICSFICDSNWAFLESFQNMFSGIYSLCFVINDTLSGSTLSANLHIILFRLYHYEAVIESLYTWLIVRDSVQWFSLNDVSNLQKGTSHQSVKQGSYSWSLGDSSRDEGSNGVRWAKFVPGFRRHDNNKCHPFLRAAEERRGQSDRGDV